MPKASVFKNNQTQAVRIPKSIAFSEDVKTVEIVRVGRSLLISPEDGSWESFFEGPKVDDDFLTERNQPNMQEREQF
ncbi:MAG: type II toxin-antitoxin system VapB family antitoxin [Pseudomonadales bacterium]|tara:strand:+ start:97 stop:327 length:231 start_codon:yes stop_codon:yes gene_type:complete